MFIRLTEIVHLHVGGQTIRTTQEHLFFVYNRGWVPLVEVNAGECILTDGGDWKCVEEVCATGQIETVYNLRVADWHTYFVGEESWGWATWGHNLYTITTTQAKYRAPGATNAKVVGNKLHVVDDSSPYDTCWFTPRVLSSADLQALINGFCTDNRLKIGDTLQSEITKYANDWMALPAKSTAKYDTGRSNAIQDAIARINALRQQYSVSLVSQHDFMMWTVASIPQVPAGASAQERTAYGSDVKIAQMQRAAAKGQYIHATAGTTLTAMGYAVSTVGVDITHIATGLKFEILRDTISCWERHYRPNLASEVRRAILYI